MRGKRVLVTGAGTGIGRTIALRFARDGADVAFHYSHSKDGAQSAVKEALEMGVRARAFSNDFSHLDHVPRLADEALNFLGGIDILVNNTGITFNRPFVKVTAQELVKMYTVNVMAQYVLTQRAVADMLDRQKGAVCNITSIHGLQGAPEHSVYAGTKGAIIAYTRALAIELAHKGIRVNAVAAGWVTVENYYKAIPDFNEEQAIKDAAEKVPLGKSGSKDNIADLVIFLCSDKAEYIIGQTIVADGGTTTLMSLISDFRHESKDRWGIGYL